MQRSPRGPRTNQPSRVFVPNSEIIRRRFRALVYHIRTVLAEPRPVIAYPTYEDALVQCGSGYWDRQLAEITVQVIKENTAANTGEFVHQRNACFIVKALEVSNATRVLDFGGSCGLHYFAAKRENLSPLRWAVVETPLMKEASAELASHELRFFTDIQEALHWLDALPELVLTSGALQYTSQPESYLTRLIEIGAPYLALFREALALGPRRVTIQTSRLSQNILGGLAAGIEDREVKYPRTYMSWSDYTKILTAHHKTAFRSLLQCEAPLLADGVELRQGYNFVYRRR
jgi:putative methyltransferase (TIGR04325 family)